MEDIVTYNIYDYVTFVNRGKYHMAIWINSHVVMAIHICGLVLQH